MNTPILQNSKNPYFRKRWRKQHILLLEVLLAFTLVALCAIPLMRAQFAVLQHELNQLRDLQLERYARDAYMQIVAQLLTHEKEWDFFCRNKTIPIELPRYTVNLGGGRTAAYLCVAEIHIQEQKDKNGRANYRFLDVDIIFNPLKYKERKTFYSYQLLTKREYVGKEQPSPIF